MSKVKTTSDIELLDSRVSANETNIANLSSGVRSITSSNGAIHVSHFKQTLNSSFDIAASSIIVPSSGVGTSTQPVYFGSDGKPSAAVAYASATVSYASTAGDANTVDGKHASDFASAGHTHGSVNWAASAGALRASSGATTGLTVGDATHPVYFSNGVPVSANAIPTNTNSTYTEIVGATSSAVANASATNGNVWLNLVENGSTVIAKHKITGTSGASVTADASGNIVVSANLDTHYTTHLYAGSSGVASNAATTNGNTYLKVADNTTVRDNINIVGSGAMSVSTDSTGKISITASTATASADGLMTSAMVAKLATIASSANNYSHPTTAGNKHIPSGGSSGQILRWSADGTAVWGADTDTNSTYKMVVASTATGTTSTATTDGNTFVNVIENGSTKVGGMKLVGTNIGITATSDGVITFSTAANPTSVASAGTASKASGLTNTSAIGGLNQPVYFGADGKPSAANAYVDNNSTYKLVVASTAAGTTSTATTNGNTFVNVIENGSTKVGGMKLVGTNIGITATSDGIITFSTAANPTSVPNAGNADTVDSHHASEFVTTASISNSTITFSGTNGSLGSVTVSSVANATNATNAGNADTVDNYHASDLLSSAYAYADSKVATGLTYKGTIGTGGTVTALPTSGAKVGDVYRVIAGYTTAVDGTVTSTGDMIICITSTATANTWSVIQNNVDVFTGATATANGTIGLVKQPLIANRTQFLKGDGTWATPANSTYKMVVASTAAGTTSTATGDGNTFVNMIENGSTKVGGMKLVGTNIGITATSDGVITFSTAANPTSVATAGKASALTNTASIGGLNQPVYFGADGKPSAATAYSAATVSYAGNADTVDGKHASDFAASSHPHATSDVTALTGYSYVASQTGALATSDTLNVALAKLQAQVNTKATPSQASTAGSNAGTATATAYMTSSGSKIASDAGTAAGTTAGDTAGSAAGSSAASAVVSVLGGNYLTSISVDGTDKTKINYYNGTTSKGNFVISSSVKAGSLTVDSAIGGATQPVFFGSDGKPSAATAYSAATVAKAGALTNTTAIGGVNQPVYFGSDGKPSAANAYVDNNSTYKEIVGASSSATADAAATNGNVWLNMIENGSTVVAKHKLVGSNITVTADANGVITFSTAANPTSVPNAGNADTVDNKHASDFAPVSHTHATSDVTSLTGYTAGTTTTDIASGDTLNTALSKLQAQIKTKPSTDNNSTYKMVVASTAAGTTSTATTNGNTFVNVIENGSTKVGGMKLVGTNIGITATSDGVITFSTAANPTSVAQADWAASAGYLRASSGSTTGITSGGSGQPVFFSDGRPVLATAYSSATVSHASTAGTATNANSLGGTVASNFITTASITNSTITFSGINGSRASVTVSSVANATNATNAGNADTVDNYHASDLLSSAYAYADSKVATGLTYKGTIGTGGTVTALPASGAKVGDVYRVIAGYTTAIDGTATSNGDMIICIASTASTNTWSVVQNNVEVFTGATATANGTVGLVKQPVAGDNKKVLTGNANWTSVSDLIASLDIGTSPAQRTDYIVAQYAGGGNTNSGYYRRSLDNIFKALNSSDITTALGYTPPTTDTNSTYKMVVASTASATDSTATANGNTFVNVIENGTTKVGGMKLVGTNISISADATGVITFSTAANPTSVASAGSAAWAASAGYLRASSGATTGLTVGDATHPVYFSNGVPVSANAIPTNTNSTYKNIVGASSSAVANASATNGNVWMNLIENGSTVIDKHNIVGSGMIGVTADATGKISISAPAATTFAASSHTHATSDVTALTGYSYVASQTGALATSDTLNVALAKLQAQINTKPSTDNNSTYKMVVASTAAGTTSTATTNGNTFVNVIENGSTKVGGMKLVGTNIGITATSDGVITFSTAANPTSVAQADWAASAGYLRASSGDTTGITSGSSGQPVFFSDGRPVLATAYSSATVAKAGALTNTTAIGGANQPVYFGSDGKPSAANVYPTFTDTNSMYKMVVANTATAYANASATNGNTFVNLVENTSTIKGSLKIVGSNISVTANNAGVVTLSTPANTNSTYKTVVASTNTATSDTAATDGNVWMNTVENGSTVVAKHKFVGSNITVTADANGVITFSTAANPTSVATAGKASALTNSAAIGGLNQPVYFGADGKPSAANTYPTFTDTNSTYKMVVASTAAGTTSTATTNGNTFVNVIENGSTKVGGMKLVGSNIAITATSDGIVTFSGTTDTHWTTKVTVGTSGATSDTASVNSNTYINVFDNTTLRKAVQLTGTGNNIVSASAGVITVAGDDITSVYVSSSKTNERTLSFTSITVSDGIPM